MSSPVSPLILYEARRTVDDGDIWHDARKVIRRYVRGSSAHIPALDSSLQELPVPDRLVWVPEGVPAGPPFNVAQMYVRFAESIRTGQSMEPDFDSAVRRHKLLESIQDASDQGRRVHLD